MNRFSWRLWERIKVHGTWELCSFISLSGRDNVPISFHPQKTKTAAFSYAFAHSALGHGPDSLFSLLRGRRPAGLRVQLFQSFSQPNIYSAFDLLICEGTHSCLSLYKLVMRLYKIGKLRKCGTWHNWRGKVGPWGCYIVSIE